MIRPALGVIAIALGLLAGPTRPAGAWQDPPDPPGAPPKPVARLVVQVVDAADRPLAGVEVAARFFYAGRGRSVATSPTTDANGEAEVAYDPTARLQTFDVTLTKPGYVPAHVRLDAEHRPIALPPARGFRLERGTTVGGVVRDEAGKPVAGATVSLLMRPEESDLGNYYFSVGRKLTDADGRWRVDEAPADLKRLNVGVEHPRYIRSGGQVAPGLDSVTAVLKEGLTLRGSVVDAEGRPVGGARAVLGRDIWGTDPPTAAVDDRGRFALYRCKPGASVVTVQADGYAPAVADVVVRDAGESGPVAVRLEPGRTLRGRVVDRDGRPVAGAGLSADTWRGLRSLSFRATTDADGRFEWRGAPADAVQFDFYKEGLMSARNVPLGAGDAEAVVTMHGPLVISGAVVDKATGTPIPEFAVIRGAVYSNTGEVSWSTNEPTTFRDGRYTQAFREPNRGIHIRVEAPGYKAAESRGFRPDEGEQACDFALERAVGLAGVVVGPDGRPAEGAEVGLARPGAYLKLDGPRFDRHYPLAVRRADAEGRFEFPPPDGPFLLVAAAEAGFAEAEAGEFAESHRLALAPWGRVAGRVMLGDRPGADQPVALNPAAGRQSRAQVHFGGAEVHADAAGRFAFEHVIPGPSEVARVVVTEHGNGMATHTPGWQARVDVKPGAAVEVVLGGAGCAVAGRVVLDGSPDRPVDWRQNEPVVLRSAGFGSRAQYVAQPDADGRFAIPDVPPGRYRLTVEVGQPPGAPSAGLPARIGGGTRAVEVPGGDSRDPVDLGDVAAQLDPTLRPGADAPDFAARRLDVPDGSVRLGDRRGKVVVLHFWASNDPASLADLPALRDLQATFGADPRFELIGLNGDGQAEVAQRAARDRGMTWTQAAGGPLHAGVAARYLVRSLPATFVVGPDGKVLARGGPGVDLKAEVRRALAEPARDRPPR